MESAVSRAYIPPYLLTLLIVSPFITDYLFPAGRASPAFSEKTAQLTIYGLALQVWSKPSVYWNTPAWSLSCELFFYLCFPLIAVCLRERRVLKTFAAGAVSVLLPVLLIRMGVPPAWK